MVTNWSKQEWAIWAVSKGWYVFPCHRFDKTPRWKWSEDASHDLSDVYDWWERHPQDNIGIATKPSGLVIVDLDTRDEPLMVLGQRFTSGMRAFEHIAKMTGVPAHSWWPPTHAVRTPKDGLHLYFQAPYDIVIPNKPLLGAAGLIDIRAAGGNHGGYVLGPGSTNNHGKVYRSNQKGANRLPEWLLRLLKPQPIPTPPKRYENAGRGNWESLAHAVERSAAGQRNSTLHWAACKIAEEGGSKQDAVDYLLDAFLRTGEHHTEEEALSTILSAFRNTKEAG